ncbi:hypothetical protein DFR28_102165 [Arenicella xantha]|uniref:Uncharacterized protein n=1 Tax=Arenicella xantha TaxID=644221 RepID=A0A395JIY7_9GAMM|nr:hypothetical protein DFR28_102165 [Arenicella xantha]
MDAHSSKVDFYFCLTSSGFRQNSILSKLVVWEFSITPLK